jgi:hypothetical protein
MSTGENLDITSNYVPCVSNLLFIDHHWLLRCMRLISADPRGRDI